MLTIKLQRIGKKHQPGFRLVVAEKRSKLGGPPVEDLGSYNPFTKQGGFKKDRIEHWIKSGAKPTISSHNLLVRTGVLKAKKVTIKLKKPKQGDIVPVASAASPKAEPSGI